MSKWLKPKDVTKQGWYVVSDMQQVGYAVGKPESLVYIGLEGDTLWSGGYKVHERSNKALRFYGPIPRCEK